MQTPTNEEEMLLKRLITGEPTQKHAYIEQLVHKDAGKVVKQRGSGEDQYMRTSRNYVRASIQWRFWWCQEGSTENYSEEGE